MQFRHLRTFVCVARNGSFSRAAEILHIAQPALSQQIKQLEDELGTALFVRYARGVRLSRAGETMLDGAEDILLRIATLKMSVQVEATTVSGDVRLGLPTTVVKLLGRSIAKRMDLDHPGIQLHLIEAMSGHLCDWLAKGQLDVAILYDPPFYSNFPNAMTVRPMLREAFSLILPGTMMVGPEPLKVAEFADIHFVFPGKLHAIRALIAGFLVENEIDIKTVIEVDSLGVTSREVVRVFLKQLWFQFVPVFHGLQGRYTMKN
jgi:LysR family nitrogen assimilation transcriptional regulator